MQKKVTKFVELRKKEETPEDVHPAILAIRRTLTEQLNTFLLKAQEIDPNLETTHEVRLHAHFIDEDALSVTQYVQVSPINAPDEHHLGRTQISTLPFSEFNAYRDQRGWFFKLVASTIAPGSAAP